MAQTLSEIKSLLSRQGLRPRHGLGQNFLHDQNKLRRIVEAAAIEPGETVLEVGAGTGALTEALLEAGARVMAVEVDANLVAILRDRLGEDRKGFTLLETDALAGKRRVHPEIERALGGRGEPFKLIANLPYNIASPLLATLAADWPGMRAGIVMVQREVADRLTAGPGSKLYGPLGIMVQAVFEARRVTTLPPQCFWPRPKVGSAVVHLARRDRPMTEDPHRLAALVQKLFGKRRKQIGSILGRDTPLPAGIDPDQRPEQLSLEQLVELAETLPGPNDEG
jgi:16S rRNA (adenine1518-N6/adenine1519-N6)-dimethyltransferase